MMDISEQIASASIMEAMGDSNQWEDLMDKSLDERKADLAELRRGRDGAISRQAYGVAAMLRVRELQLMDEIQKLEEEPKPDESGIKPIPEGRFDTDANSYHREQLWRELMAEYNIDEYYVEYDKLCRPMLMYPMYREDEVCAADYMEQFESPTQSKPRNVWADTRDFIWSLSPEERDEFEAAAEETLSELQKVGCVEHRPWSELRDAVLERMTPEERAAFDESVREMREKAEMHERIMERRRTRLERHPRRRKYRRVMSRTGKAKPRTEYYRDEVRFEADNSKVYLKSTGERLPGDIIIKERSKHELGTCECQQNCGGRTSSKDVYYRDEVEFDEWSRAYVTATGQRLRSGSYRLIDRED